MRNYLFLIVLALIAGTVSATAQESGRIYKLGWLTIGRPGLVVTDPEKWTGNGAAFRDGLKSAGFVPGKNLVLESRHASGDPDKLGAEAKAFVASGVDVIVTAGTPPTVAAMQATKTIPIVFLGVGDPEMKGMVASLAKPGGNVTGMSALIADPKLWQNLREVAPKITRAGYIGNGRNLPSSDRAADYLNLWHTRMVTSAAAAGIEPIHMPLFNYEEIEARIKELAAGSSGAVIAQDATLLGWRKEILALALLHRIPTSCAGNREWADAGCLVTYVEDYDSIWRSGALQVAKVLKGAKPADIPVEQPTTYKTVINLKTAREMGLTIAPTVLAKADEIIE